MATILIVDDLSANRKALVTLLGHQDHELFEAVDGREGLAVVKAAHPDLVITDVLSITRLRSSRPSVGWLAA